MLSCRLVGMKSDGNCCPCLLSPTAPSTRCIGDSVARFASLCLPHIEADQQTTPERGPQEAGSTTRLCNAPSATPAAMPHPLQRVIERCSPPASNGCNIGTRLPWDLPLGKRENELYCFCNCNLVIRL